MCNPLVQLGACQDGTGMSSVSARDSHRRTHVVAAAVDFDAGEAGWVEPSTGQLAAIEAESPILAAELAVVIAECRAAVHPGPVTRRGVRRALRELAAAHARCRRDGLGVADGQAIA